MVAAVVEALREVVMMGVLGSILIVAEIGGREWEGVLVEVAEGGVGRMGEVVVL